jgi:hypothetical protein
MEMRGEGRARAMKNSIDQVDIFNDTPRIQFHFLAFAFILQIYELDETRTSRK